MRYDAKGIWDFFSYSFFQQINELMYVLMNTDQPTDWLIDWLTEWLTDWLAGWMTEGQTHWMNE